MESSSVYILLQIYNILSGNKPNSDGYKETWLYKNIAEDPNKLILALNKESIEKIFPSYSDEMKTKFGLNIRHKKIYQLFGKAFRHIIDTYGASCYFSEDEMTTKDEVDIKENEFGMVIMFLRMKSGIEFDKETLKQYVSPYDIYLHFYCIKFRSITGFIIESSKLRPTELKLEETHNALMSTSEYMKRTFCGIKNVSNDIEMKYNTYDKIIKAQNEELESIENDYENRLHEIEDYKFEKRKIVNDVFAPKIRGSKMELCHCINKLMNDCGLNKK